MIQTLRLQKSPKKDKHKKSYEIMYLSNFTPGAKPIFGAVCELLEVDPAEDPATQHSGFTSEGWDKCPPVRE